MWRVYQEEIKKVFIEYFSDLFTSSEHSDFIEIMEAMQPKVKHSMNSMLVREFQVREVHKALK